MRIIIKKGVFMVNDNIDCTVKSCKYCECSLGKCKLNCIKISNCGKKDTKESTMCASYKKR